MICARSNTRPAHMSAAPEPAPRWTRSLTHERSCTGLAVTLCAFVLLASTLARASGLELEQDPKANTPARAPQQAWRSISGSLPEDIVIRRVAFAGHGVFVFFSPAGTDAFQARFFTYTDPGLEPGETEDREAGLCRAAGVAPEQVAPALEALLAHRSWRDHASRMETLVLECHRDTLFWMLMPMPEGGYREGVAIPTYDVPFDARPELELER